MQFTVPTPHEWIHGARALVTIARTGGELSDAGRSVLRAGHRILSPSSKLDIDALAPISAPELAAAELRPALRPQLLGAMVVMSMADGEVQPAAAELIAEYAGALEIESSAIANLARLAKGHYRRARLDTLRRQWAPKKLRELASEEGFSVIPKAILTILGGAVDPALSARYIELGKLADGTLGRSYFDYMIRNELPFPGEAGSPPEVILFHDMTHILSGYDTTPEEEILAASFSAGYSTYEVHNWFVFVLSQFQLGLQTAPGVPPARMMMDPERLLIAVRRGAAMNINLNEDWDYWEVIEEPVDALRERYNILPESAFAP